jgi:hypothetical protein
MPDKRDKQMQTVSRRKVFYIPGYDPFHPRRYRELYRKEGAAQAAISGYDLALRPKTGGGPYGWHVSAVIEGGQVETDIEVLVWSDIVKTSMSTGIFGTYLQLLRTAWAYIGYGALFRLMRLRKGPIIAALFPIGVLLAQLAVALLAAWGIGAIVTMWLPWWTGFVGLAAVPPILLWFRAKDNKVFAYYLMHDYAYSAQADGANPPELEARMRDFADQIAASFDEPYQEVLIVGHSSGALLAVSIIADLLRAGRVPAGRISLLTLGQVFPMVSFLPKAQRLRADLAYMSAQGQVPWVDVTAPGDGCAFALCDPAGVSGVAPADQKWPLIFSAAYTQTLSPERWAELRWRFFRLHFQYLCAFDRPGAYDYFRITAGPMRLWDRFQGRPHSPSRLTAPVNRFTST